MEAETNSASGRSTNVVRGTENAVINAAEEALTGLIESSGTAQITLSQSVAGDAVGDVTGHTSRGVRRRNKTSITSLAFIK